MLLLIPRGEDRLLSPGSRRYQDMEGYRAKDMWHSDLYESTQAYQFEYGRDLIDDLLKPQMGERILDLGCGTGQITSTIAEKGAVVTGIDASQNMIDRARENYPGLEFLVADGADFFFPEPFDAVYSSATLHWILEPERAAACIARALRPGGRFVAQLSGRGSVNMVFGAAAEVLRDQKGESLKPALFFPSIGEYATILEKSGIEVVFAVMLDHMTRLDGGEEGFARWLETFAHGVLPGSTVEERRAYLPLLEVRLRDRLWKEGHWHIDYRRLRILAFKNRSKRPEASRIKLSTQSRETGLPLHKNL
jgi:SAM-dependent methyltransferase